MKVLDGSAQADGGESVWLRNVSRLGKLRGGAEKLGERHLALMSEGDGTLLVTFESVAAIRASDPEAMPDGVLLADATGWSQLCVLARGDTWYRDPAVYAYFDRLVDEEFFECYDRVIFYGSGAAGYAAIALSVTAPGSQVIAVHPQATLDRGLAEFDLRYPRSRRLDFNDRYGYAPDMAEAAEAVYLFYDPTIPVEAAHASLFRGSHVRRIRCRNFGHHLADDLRQTGVLTHLFRLAASGRLDSRTIHRALRIRRRHERYLAGLVRLLVQRKLWSRARLLCRIALERGGGDLFRTQLDVAEAALARAASHEAIGLADVFNLRDNPRAL